MSNARRASPRFGIGATMALVAATAVGLAVDRFLWYEHGRAVLSDLGTWPDMSHPSGEDVHEFFYVAGIAVGPLVAAWSLAILAATVRGPRLRWRWTRRPGLLACFVLLPVLVLSVVLSLLSWWRVGVFSISIIRLHLITAMGPAVLGAWSGLAMGRGWRPEPSWADRAGRVFGVYWMVVAAVVITRELLWS